MSERLELRLQSFDRRPRLEVGRAVAAAEVRRIQRRLERHAPVERRDDDARHVVDDRVTAGRPDDHHEPPVRVEHESGRHRTARTLARLDPVRDRSPALLRDEREVGELVVEQEPAHEPVVPEQELDARGQRHRIALGVDDGDVRRRGKIGLDAVTERRGRGAGRAARPGADERPVRRDQARALRQVRGREQPGDRNVDEVRIGHVAIAIGVGESRGFREVVHRRQRIAHEVGFRQALEDPENLQDRDAAARRRAHAADAVSAECTAHRRSFLRLVAREILHRQVAAAIADRSRDVGGDRAAMERRGALLRDFAQHRRVVGVAEDRPDGLRPSRRIVEVAGGEGVAREPLVPREERVQSRRDREPVLRQVDRRRHKRGPLEPAMVAMRKLQDGERPGDPDRFPRQHRVDEAERPAELVRETDRAAQPRAPSRDRRTSAPARRPRSSAR